MSLCGKLHKLKGKHEMSVYNAEIENKLAAAFAERDRRAANQRAACDAHAQAAAVRAGFSPAGITAVNIAPDHAADRDLDAAIDAYCASKASAD
jgi:hypothetical protein